MLKFKAKSERTIHAEYLDGFILEVVYLPREQLRKMLDRCKIREWDKTTHQPVERHDDKRFAKELSKAIRGWKGLTGSLLRRLVELEEYPGDDEDVPYDPETAEGLLFHCYDLDKWLQNVMTDLDAFEAVRRADETKNSSASLNGSWPSSGAMADDA